MLLRLGTGPSLQPVAEPHGQDGATHLEHQLGVWNEGRELVGIGRIGRQHLARDVAQQAAAGDDDDGEAVQQQHDQGGAEDDQRDADQQAEHDQGDVAVGGGGDGDGVVQAHHRVGDDDGANGAPQGARGLDAVLALRLALHQLDADPQQQQAADQLEVADLEQLIDDQHEDDTQDDGAGAADQDGRLLMALLEVAAGQCDDQRVVAGEHDIDQDDLKQAAPEGGR